jgi:hypothetical protein
MADIDNEQVAADTATTSAPSDTGAAESVSTDTQSSSTPTDGGASTGTDSAQADTQNGDGGKSLADGAETQQPSELDNLKKQFAGSTRSWQQEKQRREQLEKEIEDLKGKFQPYSNLDPRAIQQFVQSQSAPKVQPWHPDHPDHSGFQEKLRLAEHHERSFARAKTDEQKQFVLEAMAEDISQADRALLKQYRDSGRQELAKLQSNPQGYLQQYLQPMLKQELQSFQQNTASTYQQATQARTQVQEWIQKNPLVATPEGLKSAMDLMSQGYPFQAALATVERDHYMKLVSGADRAKQSAEEKERLLQGNASGVIQRNPNSTKKVDYRKVAEERGITSERDRIDVLFELDAKGKL